MRDSIKISRRSILKMSGTAMLSLAAPAIIAKKARAQGTRRVKVQFGWLFTSQQIGEVVSHHLGFQEEEGNAVEFMAGGPNIDPIPLVASGQYDIGQQSSSPQIMLAASKGIPVKSFAVGLQKHPYAFFSLPRAPIHTPRDMIGKKIGVQAAGGAVLLSALLRKNGIDESQVEMVTIGSDAGPLMTGKVDAIAGWQSNVGQRKMLGEDAIALSFWDNGVRLLALPYFATTDKLAAEPELFASYLRAASRGWKYAFENPEKAVEILVNAYPTLSYEDEIKAMEALKPFAMSELVKTDGWGAFDPQDWQDNLDIFEELEQFSDETPALDNVMTTQVLDATKGERARLG